MKLTEKHWKLVPAVFDDSHRAGMVGRPATAARGVLNGVLWDLKTGARWNDLPATRPAIVDSSNGYKTAP
ncbi:MAG: transposase [Gammaproteobacteria bacterium]